MLYKYYDKQGRVLKALNVANTLYNTKATMFRM